MKVVRYYRTTWFMDISFLAASLLFVVGYLFFLLTDDVLSDKSHDVFTFSGSMLS